MFIRKTIALTFFTVLCASAFAQTLQPTVWATKPDIPGFEKMVNDRLAAAQSAIDQVTSVKGARTIENTGLPVRRAASASSRTAAKLSLSMTFWSLPDEASGSLAFLASRATSPRDGGWSSWAQTNAGRHGASKRRKICRERRIENSVRRSKATSLREF